MRRMNFEKLMIIFFTMLTPCLYGQVIEHASPEKFNAYLSINPKPVLLDVSDSSERINGFIEGSVWVENLNKLEKITDTLDHDNMILVFCQKGERSLQACLYLQKKGFKHIVNLEKGLISWKKRKYKIVL